MSEVILDTITGKSTATTVTIGSTPVVSSSANSMTIRGEGSAQTSIQQGLAKAWFDVTGLSTATINDSLNTSGLTDNGTGDYTIAYANDMGSANHSTVADVNLTTSGDAQNTRIQTIAADSVRTLTTNTGNAAAADARRLFQVSHGDLA